MEINQIAAKTFTPDFSGDVNQQFRDHEINVRAIINKLSPLQMEHITYYVQKELSK